MWRVTFMHPGLLALAAAAAVPVIIHLFSRRRPRVVRFPAVRFVLAGRRKSSRRVRLRHLLLLLLRMALVALFAALVARPVLTRAGGGGAAADAEGTPAAVLILDDSLSMGYRSGDSTRFERARNAAVELAGRLPPGVAAAVLTTSRPTGRLRRPAQGLAGRILGLKCGTRSAPCWAALESAARMLGQGGLSRRDVFLFTDMTPSAWLGHEHRVADVGPDVDVCIVDCAPEPGENGAVAELRDSGEPALVGAMLRLDARVIASGGPLARSVQFEYDGSAVERQQVVLGAGEQTTLAFSVLLAADGHHWGRVTFLNPDGLPADDARAFTIDVAPAVNVLCVEDEPGLDAESASYFFRLALNPWERQGRGVFRIRRASPAELADIPLAPFDVVALVGAGAMTEEGWRRLDAYVSGGGGLLAFLGPETADAYRTTAARALLPAQVGAPVAAPPGSPLMLRTVSLAHPLVEAVADSGATLAQVRYRQCRRVVPSPDAQELMSFGPGLPALVLSEVGGRAALFASTADERWGEFAKTEPFVPFCHELVLHLAGRARRGARSTSAGAQVPIAFETSRWPTTVYVTPPGAAGPERLLPGTTPGRLTYWRTDAPGYYRVDFERHDGGWRGGFAVNTAPVESDLSKVPFEAVEGSLRAGSVRLASEPSLAAAGGRAAGGARELAPWLALLVLGLLVAECFLANRFYGRGTAGQEASS